MQKYIAALLLSLFSVPTAESMADEPVDVAPTDDVREMELICPPTQFAKIIGTIQGVRNGTANKYQVCVEPDPILEVSPVTAVGDRFRPVEFEVSYTQNGRPIPFEVEATLGSVEVDDDRVYVYGNGVTGTGTILIAGEEYLYEIADEPVCGDTRIDGTSRKIDCNGYWKRSGAEHIYYGAEDTQIVEWELMWVEHMWQSDWDEAGYEELYPKGKPITDPEQLANIQEYLDWANNVFRESGVYVRLVLARAVEYPLGDKDSDPLYALRNLRNQDGFGRGSADLLYGHGRTRSGTCGVAFANTSFRATWPPVSIGACGPGTFLHEIGHSVSLAHGPQNQFNEANGYMYPDFGHGWNDVCFRYDSIMSYGESRTFFTNPRLTCGEIFGDKVSETWQSVVAGDEYLYNEAYVLNMIRYTVSLVHDEHADPMIPMDVDTTPPEDGESTND
jgi:hypothetical protein